MSELMDEKGSWKVNIVEFIVSEVRPGESVPGFQRNGMRWRSNGLNDQDHQLTIP
jgi:hypothetical protein